MSSQQVMDFVAVRIVQGMTLPAICEAILDNCLAKDSMAGIGCDNMTVVVCALLHGLSEEEWREKVTKRYNASLDQDSPSSPNGVTDQPQDLY
jgi:protein phosphatase 2C family protein 2/3